MRERRTAGPVLPVLVIFVAAAALAVALALLAEVARRANAIEIDPADHGAIYGPLDDRTARANDEAIARSLDALAKAGGGDLVLRGRLAVTATLRPPTARYASQDGFPLHFGLRGAGEAAELVDVDGGTAIDFPAPRFPANLPGYDLRQALGPLAVRGGGVRIDHGGKYLVVDRLRLYGVDGVPYGLDVQNYDGGTIRAYVHDSPRATGFRLRECFHTHVDLTSRLNAAGGEIIDCTLSGRVYNESNAGLGLSLDGLRRSALQIWLENNRGPAQGRRRGCFANVFSGQHQQDGNQAWDDDPLSRAANRDAASLAVLVPPAGGEQLPPAVLTAASAAPSQWSIDRSVDPPAAVIRAGALSSPAAYTAVGAAHWLRLTAADRADLGGAWRAGDVLVVAARITLDDAARRYFAATPAAQMLINAGAAEGRAANISQRWRPGDDDRPLVAFGAATAGGARLALYVNPQLGGAGPAAELRITITAQAWILRGVER